MSLESSPSTGLLRYDTTYKCASFYDGTRWMAQGIQIYNDTKAQNTAGGASSVTTWNTRTLNTVVSGNLDAVYTSLASNILTIQPGTYYISAIAPAYNVVNHMLRLFNTTDSTATAYGSASRCGAIDVMTHAMMDAYISISAAKSYRIEHYTSSAVASNGLGVQINATSISEVYTMVTILKLT